MNWNQNALQNNKRFVKYPVASPPTVCNVCFDAFHET